jgi:hypothetical protein
MTNDIKLYYFAHFVLLFTGFNDTGINPVARSSVRVHY